MNTKRILLMALVLALGVPLALASGEGGNAGAAWDTCAACHESLAKQFAATPHAASAAGCEGCHGPSDEHVAGGGDVTKIKRLSEASPEERAATCQQCHMRGQIAHWTGSPHESRGLDCTRCHEVHPAAAPREKLLRDEPLMLCGSCHTEQRAKMYRSGHMPVREGKMTCASCHNPHGTLTEHSLHQNSINENCYTCHAEKRGPFLWEHEAVREDCANCHDVHGSIHNSMLKVKMPILCQSCHVFRFHPATTHMQTSRIAWNKSCLNCHSMIHGSNHPSGNYFTR